LFFEGSEKKAEIILSEQHASLLSQYSDDFWAEMVRHCNAQILSSTRNSSVTAYLLSESSLFVWKDRILILTCGDTRLVDAVIYFLEQIDSALVEQIIYQRKNEYCSHLQASHVLDDTKKLADFSPGKLLRFGELDAHHSYFYHMENNFQGDPEDRTYEVLIYNIDETISERLTNQKQSNQDFRQLLKLDQIIPGFQIDDFVFEPFGYSLNAISGSDYLTIHLTPQQHNSYVSFESNLDLTQHLGLLLDIFAPSSLDIISYNEPSFADKIKANMPENYNLKELAQDNLSCGYLVNYATYFKQQSQLNKPTTINLRGEYHAF
jgi:S-adenosylmethionine decarboxylase